MTASRAIQSAEVVALLRATAARDTNTGGDGLARLFLGARNRALLALMPHRLLAAAIEHRSPGSYGFAIARTAHFDAAVRTALAEGVEQIVLLGAGYDTRPVRFGAGLDQVRVFEVDHPATQARKRDIVGRLGLPLPTAHRFAPVDFTCDCLAEVLDRHGFDARRRTLILWEGVSYYLPQPAVEDVLRFAAGCAPGSRIVLDYAIRSFVAGDTTTYGGNAIARWLRRIGEPFMFGLEPSDVSRFMAKLGLAVASDLSPSAIESRYLAGPHRMLRTLGHVHFLDAVVHGPKAA